MKPKKIGNRAHRFQDESLQNEFEHLFKTCNIVNETKREQRENHR